MTSTEPSHKIDNLNFNPSLNEQLLLPKVKDHNLLIVYYKDEPLIRILSLLILFNLNNQFYSQISPKVLVLMKRTIQNKVYNKLKSRLNRTITVHNGSILPNARKLDYNRCSVILSTPKTVKNDLKEKYFKKNAFSAIIILNAEMGSTSRSLRFLVDKLNEARIIGLTQCIDLERLEKVCHNLYFEEVHQIEETQPEKGRDNFQHYSIPLPEDYFFILGLIDQLRKYEMTKLQKMGYNISEKSNFQEINAIHETLLEEGPNRDQLIVTGNLYRIMRLQRIIISQGFPAALDHLNSLKSRLNLEEDFRGKQAVKEFFNDAKIVRLYEFLESRKNLLHPKCQMLLKMVSKHKTGISVVTHNYYNANFLKQLLKQNGFSNVIQIEKPISSMSPIQLEKEIILFTEDKSNICIINSINDVIAKKSKVIIVYDVNADIIEVLNDIEVDIPKIVLLAKQTSEEARFFHLKRIKNRIRSSNLNLSIINESLAKKNYKRFPDGDSKYECSSKLPAEIKSVSKWNLIFPSAFYEYGIPYSFPNKDFLVGINSEIDYPGLIINDKTCLLLLIPETIEFFTSKNVSKRLKNLKENFRDIIVVIFSTGLENMSFRFRYHLFQILSQNHLYSIILSNEDDLLKLVEEMVKKK